MTDSALISVDELNGILGQDNVKLLDCSYGMPPLPVRIGNAGEFNIDEIAEPGARYPHTLPDLEIFAHAVGVLGIGNDDLVVVYDSQGFSMAAARVWWMFRVFGHDKVKVLDGGFPAWMEAGLPFDAKNDTVPEPKNFTATFRPEMFKQKKDIVENLHHHGFIVVDARDERRYAGAMPEPRPGIESGHIPGSHNIPFMKLIDPETGRMKPTAQLQQIVEQSGVDIAQPIACSCGSGVTAGVVALALYQLGKTDAAIYGGSWTEWGGDPVLPKTKGDAP